MASFQAKTGRDRLRMREKKIVPINSQPIRNIEFRKNSKKIKKLKNINMASFKAKTGLDQLRMREQKYSHSDPFQPDLEQGIPKKQ